MACNNRKLVTEGLTLTDLHEGCNEAGDCGNDSESQPPWMDEDKFRRGQKFFREHAMAILLALYCSLTTGLSVSNLLDPLVFTKKSDTPKKALQRYVHTFLHVALWHTGNVWDPKERAHKSVQNVRKMHNHVGKQMQGESGPRLYMSQYDMALVQCGFMGAVSMYPHGFGIRCTQQQIEDYIFFWRGIGYLLGIDDKYNMCSGTYQQTRAVCKEIEQKLLLPSLKNPPVEFERMANAYIEGTNMRRRVLSLTKEAVIAFCLDGMGLPTPTLGFRDTLRFWWLKLVVCLIKWCPGFESINNRIILKNAMKFVHVVDNVRIENQKDKERSSNTT